MITPDFTERLAHVVVGEQVGGVVVAGDHGLVVAETGGETVVHPAAQQREGIPPAGSDLIALGAHVGGVLLGGTGSVNAGKGD